LFPEESHVFDQIYSDNRVFYFVQLFGVFQQMILEKCVVFSLTKFLLLFLSHVLVFFEIFVQKIVDNLLIVEETNFQINPTTANKNLKTTFLTKNYLYFCCKFGSVSSSNCNSFFSLFYLFSAIFSLIFCFKIT
jgi:hypothetical protein